MAADTPTLIALGATLLAIAVLIEIVRLHRDRSRSADETRKTFAQLVRHKNELEYAIGRVRRTVEFAPEAFIEIDRNGTITGWNTKAADVFGWAASEAAGAGLGDLLGTAAGKERSETIFGGIWMAPARFEGITVEVEALHRSGYPIPVECTAWVDESGLEPKMGMFVRDISARCDIEAKLGAALQKEHVAFLRLQAIEKAKDDFVSSISHELRSPLTGTLGYLEMLSDGSAGELSARQAHMVESADRNAQRLLRLVEDVLTVAQIESGTLESTYRPIGVEGLIEAVVERHQSQADAGGVFITTDIAADLGAAPGDEALLSRAITNVLGNAVKFTPPTGSVCVTAHIADEQVVVAIIDNGIGIPEHEVPLLFRRFFRASSAVEQHHQGVGLGLTVAKAILEDHGASLDVHSALGVGTTVTIRLPHVSSPTPDAVDASST